MLRGVSLAVMPGESLVIIGGSGTGKSVTLKCILGILTHDNGEILIDGQPLARIDRRAFLRHFGMLFQGAALFDSLTVWQNVAFRLIHARRDPLGKQAARDLAIAKLARVGLGPDTADLYPAELSGGMQKRVGLARAIATDPEVIFFDEPTAGLDPILAHVINDLIRELVREIGATAITITHDMTTVRTVADQVAMLDGGTRPLDRPDRGDGRSPRPLAAAVHPRPRRRPDRDRPVTNVPPACPRPTRCRPPAPAFRPPPPVGGSAASAGHLLHRPARGALDRRQGRRRLAFCTVPARPRAAGHRTQPGISYWLETLSSRPGAPPTGGEDRFTQRAQARFRRREAAKAADRQAPAEGCPSRGSSRPALTPGKGRYARYCPAR